jgi:hypothetical protein
MVVAKEGCAPLSPSCCDLALANPVSYGLTAPDSGPEITTAVADWTNWVEQGGES